MKLSRHWTGVIQLVLASIGFGFLGIFGKIAFHHGLSVGAFLTYRFTLAALLLWMGCLLFRPHWIRLEAKQIFISALLGVFGYAVFSTLYFMSVKGVSVALAALLLYTYPFWVSLLGHLFLHERLTHRQWTCLVVAFIGLALLVWGRLAAHDVKAVFAGMGAAVAYALYILASAHWQRHVRPLSSSLYVISFAALALYLYHRPSMSAAFHLSPAQASSVLGIAIISTIIPLTLVLAGLQKMKSSEAALLTMIEPVTAAVMAWFIFHETLTSRQMVGAALVLGALAARSLLF